ncbi:MAG: hypothetical protein Q7V01_10785, partial [Vicinamibacterales bacterium]|nr:hypothetical protein [Vicinamibacterales bacterium]
GAQVYRGPGDDVLARYVGVVHEFGGRFVIRATADNPAVDVDAPARLVKSALQTGAEYAVEQGLPYGAAVELISSETLRRLESLAASPEDREHVTLFVTRNLSRFRTAVTLAPTDLRRPDLRLTIDTPDDLAFMRRVLEKVDDGPDPAPLMAVIAAADAVIRRAKAA